MLKRMNSGQSIRPTTGTNVGTGLPPFLSVGVLVAGVVGGLVVVLSAIFFCKPCLKWISRRKNFYMSKFFQRRRRNENLEKKSRGCYENLELKLSCTGSFPEVTNENTYISRDSREVVARAGRGSAPIEMTGDNKRALSPDNENIDLVVASYKQSVLANQISMQIDDVSQSPNHQRTDHRSKNNTPSPVSSLCNQSKDRSCLQIPTDVSDWRLKHDSFMQSEKAGSFGGYSEPRPSNPA